jgi:DNA-binding protein HU-beta
MSKAKMSEKVAEKLSSPKTEASRAIEAFLDSIQEALASGDEVKLPGFGSFSVAKRKERQGRNPQTGEIMTIPANKTIKFSPGKSLKEAVKK